MAAPDYGQGEKTLTRAAGLVADAKAEFDGISKQLMNNVETLRSQWGTVAGASGPLRSSNMAGPPSRSQPAAAESRVRPSRRPPAAQGWINVRIA